jgi:cysteine desulfurase
MVPKPIYLDYAATTPVRPEVRDAMLPYLGELFGNPSSSHSFGREVRAAVEQARRQVAQVVQANPEQVVFTSGGTEADNLAVLGACYRARGRGEPMLTAVPATEHKAVLAAAHEVGQAGGGEITLPVNRDGLVELAGLDRALARRPAIVSVMWVNNETGVIQPIREIAARCRRAGVLFHSDLVQAFGKIPVSLREIPLDFASISGHKIGAPKGIGALVLRDPSTLVPLQHGGGQQRSIRPGTENVAGIVALGAAAMLAMRDMEQEQRRLELLRDELAGRLMAAVPDMRITGESAPRVAHILNVQVAGADSEALLTQLDLAGIAASGGSACSTGNVEPSHELTAMGVERDRAIGAIRFSLGRATQREDIFRTARVFPVAVSKVRRLAVALGRAS